MASNFIIKLFGYSGMSALIKNKYKKSFVIILVFSQNLSLWALSKFHISHQSSNIDIVFHF